jgi:hypothetical protein
MRTAELLTCTGMICYTVIVVAGLFSGAFTNSTPEQLALPLFFIGLVWFCALSNGYEREIKTSTKIN